MGAHAPPLTLKQGLYLSMMSRTDPQTLYFDSTNFLGCMMGALAGGNLLYRGKGARQNQCTSSRARTTRSLTCCS